MPDENSTTAPVHARRRGQRMSAAQKRHAKETFLKALGNTANVRAACIQAGIDSSTVYRWQEHDEEFSYRFKQANVEANWLLFGEAWKRAMQGEERYVISRGELVRDKDGKPVTYREKSDRMLELLLKTRLPEFRDKQHIDITAQITALAETAKQELLADLAQAVADEKPSHQS